MYNGQRQLLDVPIDTPDLNNYVQALQMRMKAILPKEFDAHCVVDLMQILDGVDYENQLVHADHFADCVAVVILLEGSDLTEMCDIPYVNMAKPKTTLLLQNGIESIEAWEDILHKNYVMHGNLSATATWTFPSYCVREQKVFIEMLKEMKLYVESEFVPSEDLYRSNARCIPKGSAKPGDAIIFWTNMLHYGPKSRDRRVVLYVRFETMLGAIPQSVRRKLETASQPIYYENMAEKVKMSPKAARLESLQS